MARHASANDPDPEYHPYNQKTILHYHQLMHDMLGPYPAVDLSPAKSPLASPRLSTLSPADPDPSAIRLHNLFVLHTLSPIQVPRILADQTVSAQCLTFASSFTTFQSSRREANILAPVTLYFPCYTTWIHLVLAS
ncbi:hypothetical protein BDZ85DRAFT_265454 [Elsinoe ampelina]|uniref:Uncharacterized protein n=1 Tax=Elsinoe ampelina TaxID=302913 RepID=A0A6A6G7C1_9PEZI|nr:hypothetical protein BDZ85DRAFT_265454 [Elsinoe ampelina]